MTREELILEKLRSLLPERLDEVLDFVEFVERRTKRQRWISFDAWAMNMAKPRFPCSRIELTPWMWSAAR